MNVPNYPFLKDVIIRINKLDENTNAALIASFSDISFVNYDNTTKCIQDNAVRNFLNGQPTLVDLVDANDGIPVNNYLLLYIHKTFSDNVKKINNYKDVIKAAENTPIYQKFPILCSNIEFFSLAYVLINSHVKWKEFIHGFEPNDWSDIHHLQWLLPIGNLSLEELCNWLKVVVKAQENDGALTTIGDSIYSYVIELNDISIIEESLVELGNEDYVKVFFAAFLTGLKKRQNNQPKYYYDLLEADINKSNANDFLFALGRAYTEDKIESNLSDFFSIISGYLKSEILSLREYLMLCTTFSYYNANVYNTVTNRLEEALNSESIYTLIRYLYNSHKNIDTKWYETTVRYVFLVNNEKITRSLEPLLINVADINPALAFNILEERFQIMLGENLLEHAIVSIAKKHTFLFQQKFIDWAKSDDERLHLAIAYLIKIHSLGNEIFHIPKTIFDTLSFSDKLFIAYKFIGYIHSMEVLQNLFVSLGKSIDLEHEVFADQYNHLLCDYLIYNYRGTLEILRNELTGGDLLPFAKSQFEEAVKTFEGYFKSIRDISATKELTPYSKIGQIKNFYQRKHWEEIQEEQPEEGFLQGLFKPIVVNSNKWAIRRPGELKHVVTPLGHISVTGEFPSGEILNPFNQEFMRKSCRKKKRDEVNID